MDAVVTFKCTAAELDFIRLALRTTAEEASKLAASTVGKDRQGHREVEAQARFMLERLGG